jgi:methylenetetrahydrofolate reductase (NADPH)
MAGSIKTPRGPFVSSREMMETGLLDEFRSVAFAAHPEGNPVAKDYETGSAITWKNRYAREHEDVDVSLITQLSFNAENVLRWAERTRLEGNKLPIHVGMAGPASLFEKFDYARKCGMGSAFKVAKAQGLNIVSFFKTVPSEMIREIVEVGGKDTFGKPLVQGLHFYTFNRVSRTVDFLHRMGEGAFREKGRGFVMEPG